MRNDLVKGGVHEPGELNLRDRFQPVGRHPDGRPDDTRLGKRGVEHPILAELVVEALRGPENAAVLAHVFAEDEDIVVALEFAVEPVADCLYQREVLCVCLGAHYPSRSASSP